MAYIALKPCRFAGQSFKIGETIPDEVIHPGSAKNLVKMEKITPADGYPTETKTNAVPTSAISVMVRAEEGDLPLEVTVDGLQQIFDVLTTNVENAEAIIAQMTDGDALILLHVSDSRKSLKPVIEARAKALNEDGAGEDPKDPEDPANPEDPENPVNPEDGAGEE